jgi:predicted HTH transcriptional regulator
MKEIEKILLQLIKVGYETEVVEFKEAKNQYDFNKLGKYFSALSNEANLYNKENAWLIFGVRDSDKAFVNWLFRFEQCQSFRFISASHFGVLVPPVSVLIVPEFTVLTVPL